MRKELAYILHGVLFVQRNKMITTWGGVTYTNGVEEELFKVSFCLPAGPYVTDDDVHYIAECLKEAIAK